MQVLGTVQPGQQTPQQLGTGLGPAAPLPATSQAGPNPSAVVPTSTANKNKNKNNSNQRAICPKPLGVDGVRVQGTPVKKKKPPSKVSKSKETAQADSLSDSLQIQIPESTTDPETASAMSSESTDILAKAAESIFSSPNGEVATVGGFYNPANEDNPLHIDTSVTEAEDEKKSPVKQPSKAASTSKGSALQDSVIGLNSVADGAQAVKVSGGKTNKSGSGTESNVSNNDTVTSLSATFEEIAEINFTDTSTSSLTASQNKSRNSGDSNVADKSGKKNRSGSKVEDLKTETKGVNKSSAAKSKSKKQTENEKSVLEMEKLGSDSQMEFESTLIHIPEEITFSENDLSDVLDQVEQLGNTSVDSPAKTSTSNNKKSKSKRTKPADTENEPSSKKRKSVKESKPPSSASRLAPRTLLSMPTNLSVYDFDESDDIVPSLLPLSEKEFSNTSTSAPSKMSECALTESMDVSQKNDNKNKPSSQNTSKPKMTASNQKTVKTNKTGKEAETSMIKESVSDQIANVLVSENTDGKKQTKDHKVVENKNELGSQSVEEISSLTDLDTTTSLFGVPVNKKQQRVDTSARPNTSVNKTTPPQVQQKQSPQSTAAMVSPKQTLVSPKSQSSIVSPSPNNAFSPELVSPKLSIVSPGQGMLSDSDRVSPSPKHSPLKKRSPVGKMDNLKVSSFSALNSVPLADSGYSSAPMSNFEDKSCSQNTLTSYSQSTGVITAAATSVSSQNTGDMNKLPQTNSANQNEANVVNKPALTDKTNVIQSNSQSNIPNQKPQHRNSSASMENNYNTPQNVAPTQRPVVSSVNSSQNARYGAPYGNDQGYGNMASMNVNQSMAGDPRQTGSTMGNFPTPYSSESLFNPQPEKVLKSPPNVNISTLNQQKQDSQGMLKLRSNPYSVDNFVETSREDGMRARPDSLSTHPGMMGAELTTPSTDFSRLQSESSPDGFNFANIGLNLQPITSTAGSYMENSSSGPANMSSSFSFSLSSTSTTVTTTSSGIGHHQFSFFPPILSSASNVPSSQSALPASMSNMDMFDQNRAQNEQVQRNSLHPPGSTGMPRGDSVQRPDKNQPPMTDDTNRDTANKPSCSKQKLQKAQGPATIQEPFPPYGNSSSTHDNNFFHDTQMKSNVGKSSTEQMRKPQEKSMEIGSSQSRSSSQTSIPDKRVGNMDRSPQMMNNPQSYYPTSNFPPSKSLNTPPLHHPGMMPSDDRVRNITNRSPYDTPFPHPPASQGFNNMGPNFSTNRFDSGPPSFSRDNSGTQPLSHTPVNTGGRKSANPSTAQTSVVKPPQKQNAPPLVPMGGPPQAPPSQGPRPTPPQSHRATTPHANQTQPAPNPSQVNQSRQSKQPSRNSKLPTSSKKSKTLPFMEVDSNLSNSIFETNRSMTPFFPMQNLSPQSRAMQHEGSSFLPGVFPGPRFPNSNTPMPKNTDIGPPFNPLFPGRGAQNSLGLSFQPGFGMNMNPLHGNHGNGPQLAPHSASHMTNFSFNSIFTDGASQNDNISPIKFPHTNYQGMEHNPMQHHHQYNRGHPSVMSINSILGPNPHGFDGRMNTSMAGPFHSHGHPSFIPPLNFSMHDH